MSKTYKVERELPTLKVGDPVEHINTDMGMHFFEISEHVRNKAAIHCTQSAWNLLILDGWIEEIKPREFELQLYEDGSYELKINSTILSGSLCFPLRHLHGKQMETIKLREVIEE